MKKKIFEELALAGVAIDEDNLILQSLNGIGNGCREVATTIHARESSISFEELHDKLTAFELHLKQETAQIEISILTDNYTKKWRPFFSRLDP
ncbi:hypothetical protein REPUB_Repub14bG0049500 [Reevesia pubescens]